MGDHPARATPRFTIFATSSAALGVTRMGAKNGMLVTIIREVAPPSSDLDECQCVGQSMLSDVGVFARAAWLPGGLKSPRCLATDRVVLGACWGQLCKGSSRGPRGVGTMDTKSERGVPANPTGVGLKGRKSAPLAWFDTTAPNPAFPKKDRRPCSRPPDPALSCPNAPVASMLLQVRSLFGRTRSDVPHPLGLCAHCSNCPSRPSLWIRGWPTA